MTEPPRQRRAVTIVRIVLCLAAVLVTAFVWSGVSLKRLLTAFGF